ncbi:hypothetical protein HU200_063115 [Digitaria exilis]|uniref:Uncharacterized protein n=1 Tax=Digitaria exilis TaxID=1010633 RepID=A0A835A256_9POAL|nr:hypothetical protein HU200_063115 [Digitaria exilis]
MFGDVPAVAACDYLTGVGAAAVEASNINMAGEAAYGLGRVDGYSAASVVPPARHGTTSSPLVFSEESLSSVPCYDHEVKAAGSQQQGSGAPTAAFLDQIMIPSRMGIQSAGMGSSGSGPASVAMTKRKSVERVGGNTKRSKQEASRKASPSKPQAPKVKLAEKITALQQIVSPFGKLFSEPYMTKSAYKGRARFGSEGEDEEAGSEHGLRGRGLCLSPVSLTSQVYHDDGTLLDCWTPAYRSSLYYTGR